MSTHIAPQPVQLRLIHGKGLSKPNIFAKEAQKQRLELGSIFIDTYKRQLWINKRVQQIWHGTKSEAQKILTQTGAENSETLAMITRIRTSFLISINHTHAPGLEVLLDSLALLACHSHQIITAQIDSVPTPSHYTRAYTSSDFFALDSKGQKTNLKQPNELAATLRTKDLDFDTSAFEKEIVAGALSALSLPVKRAEKSINHQQITRFLLSIFTALNQKKLLTPKHK